MIRGRLGAALRAWLRDCHLLSSRLRLRCRSRGDREGRSLRLVLVGKRCWCNRQAAGWRVRALFHLQLFGHLSSGRGARRAHFGCGVAAPRHREAGEHTEDALSHGTTDFRQGLPEFLRTPPIFVAAGIEAVMYLGYGAFLGFLPIYAKKVGLNDAEIAIVFGAQLTLAMVAKPIAGRVSYRAVRITDIIVC